MGRLKRFGAAALKGAAKLEAGAVSLIPIDKRLRSTLAAKSKAGLEFTAANADLTAAVNVRNRAIDALVLSRKAESEASDRVTAATSQRDIARAQSDLKSAQKLSAKNLSVIANADKAIAKRKPKREKAARKVSELDQRVKVLETQAKAARASRPVVKPKPVAAPIKVKTRAKRKTVKATKTRTRKVKAAESQKKRAERELAIAKRRVAQAERKVTKLTSAKSGLIGGSRGSGKLRS